MKRFLIRSLLFIVFFMGSKWTILWFSMDIAESMFWFGCGNYLMGLWNGADASDAWHAEKRARELNNENFGI